MGDRSEVMLQHIDYQIYRFACTQVHIRMRVQVTSKGAIQCIGHYLRYVAMQVKGGCYRNGFTH